MRTLVILVFFLTGCVTTKTTTNKQDCVKDPRCEFYTKYSKF